MIEIIYRENSFEILFPLKEYIPESYFCTYGDSAELNFYIDIFKSKSIFDGKEENLIEYPTFETELICQYDGIPFSMLWDDWNFISFSVREEYDKRKTELAEFICELVKKANGK